MANVKSNTDGFKRLMKNLKKDYTVRIGILGSNASAEHEGSGLTNAELGSVHEFGAHINHPGGTPYKILDNGKAQFVSKAEGIGLPVTQPHEINIPARSFLEMPLKQKLDFKLNVMKPYKKLLWKSLFVTGNPDDFYKAIMSRALHVVKTAFNTNGYGQWQSLTAGTKRAKAANKQSPNTLLATGQLKNSITGKIIKK